MTEKKFMNKMIDQITISHLILLTSMCIWKIAGTLGSDTVFMLLFISLLKVAGLSAVIKTYYTIADKYILNYRIMPSFQRVGNLFAFWVVILIIILCKGVNASFDKNYFYQITNYRRVTVTNYTYLSYGYFLTCLLAVCIPVILSVLLFRGVSGNKRAEVLKGILIAKEELISYTFNMMICLMVTGAFLITGEHRSTPAANICLNILYFGMIVRMVWFLAIRYNKTKKHINSEAKGNLYQAAKPSEKKSRYLLQTAIVAAVITGSVTIITGYSSELDFTYRESDLYPGTIEIDQYIGERPETEVPATINGRPVTGISRVFWECQYIRSVSVAQGIKIIGPYAFFWLS